MLTMVDATSSFHLQLQRSLSAHSCIWSEHWPSPLHSVFPVKRKCCFQPLLYLLFSVWVQLRGLLKWVKAIQSNQTSRFQSERGNNKREEDRLEERNNKTPEPGGRKRAVFNYGWWRWPLMTLICLCCMPARFNFNLIDQIMSNW